VLNLIRLLIFAFPAWVHAGSIFNEATTHLPVAILVSQCGGGVNRVVLVSSASARVGLANLTIRNGFGGTGGGGISNGGTLTVTNSTVSGNNARGMPGRGGGIFNFGTLTVTNSTVTGNSVSGVFGAGFDGGIENQGNAAVNNSTVSGNIATGEGGGICNLQGSVTINNSTVSGNSVHFAGDGGGIAGTVTLQNSIVANNSGGNCKSGVVSKGYNLSSDNTCNFSSSGDRNNTDPKLGPLQNNGGPTFTMALLPGSPAIDAGNPSGCKDSQGHLLVDRSAWYAASRHGRYWRLRHGGV
jgi:hypothetical protein